MLFPPFSEVVHRKLPGRFFRLAGFAAFMLLSVAVNASPLHGKQANTDTAKYVLLVFSGSDWCIPCIRLEKTLLSDSAFLQFAETRLDIVRADFPQRKKLPPEQVRSNEALAERYNPEGIFPKLLLLGPDHAVMATLQWKDLDTPEFIDQIRRILNTR
ncbi:MAG: thioredoxin family protein [Saprospiraceae bacterium]|nr:thioredoxin family protein [Saprospiraceae bacterium]MCB9355060.1 thioredoxin family protein [Lewinellaceae bacterium]